MKRGDLVKIIPDGRHGIIVDFDEEKDKEIQVVYVICIYKRTTTTGQAIKIEQTGRICE